jgi:chemotaxis protein methyltransferase CheR
VTREPPGTLSQPEIRPMTPIEFDRIRQLAFDTCGMDFAESKKDMIAARLDRTLRKLSLSSYQEYYCYVRDDPTGGALRDFIDALATNHTNFLREVDHFTFLREKFCQVSYRGRPIRIWSAACSTGEEPYSIAMTLLDVRRHELVPGFEIVASDISTRALDSARSGIYPIDRLRDLPPPWLTSFFEAGSGKWSGWMKVKKQVRDIIRFERFNLLDSPMDYGSFDVIFCRNVMLYFSRATQEGIVKRLADRLNPGGYLFTGHTESLMGINHSLNYIRPALYQRRP